jgi:hypothetical protein
MQALEAIRRYDMTHSTSNIYHNQKDVGKNLLNDLDKDYSLLTSSKKIEAEKVYKINLAPHSQ